MILNKFKRVFMGIAGTGVLFVAIFLIIFPVLPARPLLKFIKLCYFNSSEKLYEWFTNHSVFGYILDNKFILTKNRFIFRTVFAISILFVVMFLSENVVICVIATIIVIFTVIFNYYKTLK